MISGLIFPNYLWFFKKTGLRRMSRRLSVTQLSQRRLSATLSQRGLSEALSRRRLSDTSCNKDQTSCSSRKDQTHTIFIQMKEGRRDTNSAVKLPYKKKSKNQRVRKGQRRKRGPRPFYLRKN